MRYLNETIETISLKFYLISNHALLAFGPYKTYK
jgi:hypothetical protein